MLIVKKYRNLCGFDDKIFLETYITGKKFLEC